jgi:DNA-binding transcriptional LysR family regulator
MSGPGTWNHMIVAEAFRAQGMDMPRLGLTTLSMSLRTNLVATSTSIGVFPDSVLRLYGDRFSLKRLPVNLPVRPWPVTIVTLKNRTLSPLVERFIECARGVVKSFAGLPSKKQFAARTRGTVRQ